MIDLRRAVRARLRPFERRAPWCRYFRGGPRGPRPALPPLITQCILRHGARQTRPRQQQSGTNDDRSPARRRRADDGREREVVSGGLASVSCAGACNCCSEGEASVTSEAGWWLGSAAARAGARRGLGRVAGDGRGGVSCGAPRRSGMGAARATGRAVSGSKDGLPVSQAVPAGPRCPCDWPGPTPQCLPALLPSAFNRSWRETA